MKSMFQRLLQNGFLFQELVKRDFKSKYKRTVLGMVWSILSPLMMLLVMRIVFTQFFGRTMEHYTTYLFIGQIVYQYFSEATNEGMNSLTANANIFSKINVPKYIFLLSKNVSSLINFVLTVLILFIFVAIDGISFTWRFFLLVYPIGGLILLNIGVGLILSALQIMFRDVQYLYRILLQVLMYFSAIFYNINGYPEAFQKFFYFNPIFCFIQYFRQIIIEGIVPSAGLHGLLVLYAAIAMLIGGIIYKRMNYRFLYYI